MHTAEICIYIHRDTLQSYPRIILRRSRSHRTNGTTARAASLGRQREAAGEILYVPVCACVYYYILMPRRYLHCALLNKVIHFVSRLNYYISTERQKNQRSSRLISNIYSAAATPTPSFCLCFRCSDEIGAKSAEKNDCVLVKIQISLINMHTTILT